MILWLFSGERPGWQIVSLSEAGRRIRIMLVRIISNESRQYAPTQTPASHGPLNPNPCAGSDASDNGETGGGNLK